MPVWITRAAPDNLATARRLRQRGYGSVVVPVLTTRAIDHAPVDGRPDAIVFTSAHAVRHHRRPAVNDTVPVFAASEATARAAQGAGYANITSTGGDEQILSGLLAHILPPGGRIVEYCARRTSPTLSRTLSGLGLRVDHLAVYESVALDGSEIGDTAFSTGVGGIMVHSCVGARAVRRIIARNGWRGRIWCISPASAAQFAGLDGVALSCAAEPTEAALLALVEREVLPTRWASLARLDRAPLRPVPLPARGPAHRRRPARDDDDDGPPPAA